MHFYPKSKYSIIISVFVIYGFSCQSWADSNNLTIKVRHFYGYGVPLFRDQTIPGLSMSGVSYPLLKIEPNTFKRQAVIDSTGEYVEIKEEIQRQPFHAPRRVPLNDYFSMARNHYLALQWQKYKVAHLHDELTSGRRGSDGLAIDIPVKIKAKAFQTIFGGDRVGLTVNGNITINGGFRHEKRSQVRTAINRGSDYNFKMEQTQQFRVTGNVGDKVKVSVDQDSERPFDFENTIKLNYDGYEDEIIKKIEAGNIALSLPATRFVSFSGKNSGLFGLKSEMTMGNLNVTTIASQEKGENKKLTLSGGAQEGVQTIRDYNYMKGIYFFLDEVYRNNYFPLQNGIHAYDPRREISDIEVYVSTSEQDPKRIWGYAAADSAKIWQDDFVVTQEHVEAYWSRLEKTDYFVATDLGYIRLNNFVDDNKYLAVAYRDTSRRVLGDISFNALEDSIIHLKLIKPKNPRPSDKTWDLMFRHIYYLGARNIDEDGFELKLFYEPSSGDVQETIQTNEGVKSYLAVFGFDAVDETGNPTPDNKIDKNSNILRLAMGELEFPSLRPFDDPTNPFYEALTAGKEPKIVSAMYDTTNQSEINRDSKFYIEVKSKSRSATMQLGWNVIEESEEVRLNGALLRRGTDYIIDYYSGTLTVLDERATSPSADLEVTYQRNELFQLEKKTLLGMRAEYDLWENSFIGGTFIYLNQRTLDQKVRVDKGPMRNMIWDLNTALSFEPNFLTTAFDALPLIQTKQPSSLKFEGEIAQILPNPNTLNNENTKDYDGVAYIDDFEAAKKITPLGVIQGGWTLASRPVQFQNHLKMGRAYWYNDYNMTYIKEIWPNKDINPNTPQRIHTLTMVITPAEAAEFQTEESWVGIMRPLSSGYADQSDSKFIEIWISGDVGRIHIDMGQITEDVIPNGKLDTEDIEQGGIRNGLLDPGEDKGLDGMAGEDPNDFWDINGNGVQDIGEPTSWDDWSYNPSTGYYTQSNGTEGNENNVNGRVPDTEDINGNGALDQVNNYFEYSFSLNKNSPDTVFISGDNDPDNRQPGERAWYQYRIPLAEPDTVIGQPDMTRLEYVRIWVDSLPTTAVIDIAEINLVGNDWKEKGVAESDSSDYDVANDTTVFATVVNTHDNPDYIPSPGVRGVRDRITRVEAKEQSLVIRVNNLAPGANGILQKTFFQAENYIHYDEMKMFIHGDDIHFFAANQETSQVELFLRFGANEKNYYEIRQPVYAGWEGNNMEVELSSLTALKFKEPDTLLNAKGDFLGTIRDTTFVDGRKWRIFGEPSLTNVKQLILGVKNKSTRPFDYFSGEIWVNELRVSGVHKDKGVAMRARVDLKVADVFNVNAEINKQDADFHNINERFGDGDNRTGYTMSGGIQLHKFLPRSWGLTLPVTLNYKQDESTPKYIPGSDILITDETPEATLREKRRWSESKGFGFSFRKTTKSNNFFIKNTIDNLSFSFNSAKSSSHDSQTETSDRETYTGNVDYSLRFSDKANFRPFFWLGKVPIIKKLSELKFYYLPTNFSIKASGNQTKTHSKTRSGLENKTRPFVINRSAQTGYKPFTSLTFDFSHNRKSDLTQAERPKELLLNGKFGQLTDVDQSAGAKFNPKLFQWLTTNFAYTASYRWSNNLQLANTGTGRSASNNNSITGSFTFDPNKLISSLTKDSQRKGRPPQVKKPPSKKREEEKKKEEKEEKEPKTQKMKINPFKSLLKGVGFVTKNFQPISINYTERNNISYSGLEEGTPSWRFMLGLEDSTGLGIVEGVGTNRSSFRNSQNLSLQSGLKISNNIDVTLRFSQDNSKNETTQITGDLSQSALRFGKEKESAKRLSHIPFPDWTVRWTGLEKFPFLKKVAQRVSFDHSFSGKYTSSWQDSVNNVTRESYQANFRPLAGFNITWKHNISTNIRFNQSSSYEMNVRGGSGGSRTNSSDFSIQGSYSRSGGFKIPIPVWPFKNKELKNNIDLSLTFSIDNSVTEQNVRGGKWQEMNKSSKWSFKPQMSYRFSNNVSGGIHFEYGKNESKRMGTTSFQDFGINVRIEIRGS